MMKQKTILLAVCLIVICAVGLSAPLFGQDQTIITLAAPEWMADVFDDDFLEAFQAENPGVKVIFSNVTNQETFFPSPAFEPEEHFAGMENYVSKADVVYMSSRSLYPATTRAGYLLDLQPLVQGDVTLDEADFIPAVLDSYRWDNGLWGLPVTASVEVLVYDADAFDEAGLAYPNENWTLDDLIVAAEALQQTDEEGNVTVPGFSGYNLPLFIRSITGQPFYDITEFPSGPDFSNPELVTQLEKWQELQELSRGEGQFDFNEIPFALSQTWRLTQQSFDGTERNWQGALLPGGTAGLYAEGFSISAGTQNPEIAYELLKFITRNPEIVNRFFGDTPARYSMVGVEAEDDFFIRPEIDPEIQAFIDLAVENAIPGSELRFGEYLNGVWFSPEGEVTDIAAALEEAEIEARDALLEAEQRRTETFIQVATPVPTPNIGQGQIVVEFGVFTSGPQIPNREVWESIVSEFIANHPEVGNIDLITQSFGPDGRPEVDCFVEGFNNITNEQFDLSGFLNLDPFMDADPNFDRSDFIGGVLSEVERDGRIWGYPMLIQPAIMWFNQPMFEDAGLPSPEGGWTSDAFIEALEMLDLTMESDVAPFVPQTFGNTHLLMLMAAFGGIPYDHRTDPPTLNLDDPATVEAVRQVLDLAREGYIEYQALGENIFMSGGSSGEEAIISETFNTFSWRLENRQNTEFENNPFMDYRLTSFPRGSQYTPMSYTMDVAYINNTAKSPEACYEWISMIARSPELFTAMPTRYSLIDSPEIGDILGDDVLTLYQDFASQLEDPNLVTFASNGGVSSNSPGAWLEPIWLNRAFDNYVLEGADLDTELALAEENIMTYRECTVGIPEVDIDTIMNDRDSSIAYSRQFTDCAIAISPDLQEHYQFFYEDQE